jgi:hypothetical protein
LPFQSPRPTRLTHPGTDQRQRLDRPDEGIPLDQLPLDPEEPIELRGVEGADPAPEHGVLGPRHRRDRVELEEPEPAHGLEDVARRAVEKLRANGDDVARDRA